MSRRRRRPAAGAIPPVFDVVCTDRGQHRVTVLDMVVVAASTITEETLRWMAKQAPTAKLPPAGRTYSVNPVKSTRRRGEQPARPPRTGDTFNGNITWHFPCPRCGRAPRFIEDQLGAACERRREIEPGKLRYSLDVSYSD